MLENIPKLFRNLYLNASLFIVFFKGSFYQENHSPEHFLMLQSSSCCASWGLLALSLLIGISRPRWSKHWEPPCCGGLIFISLLRTPSPQVAEQALHSLLLHHLQSTWKCFGHHHQQKHHHHQHLYHSHHHAPLWGVLLISSLKASGVKKGNTV